MAYVGNPIDTQNTFQSLVGKRFNGDGSTTAFTLDVAPSSTLDIEVFVGNVRQDPNSAYTLSGTTLTFTGAPPSGTNNIYVVHQAKSVGTIGIPDDTISARTLVTADSSADHVIIEDATDGELKKALYPSGFSVSSITGATALAEQPASTDELVISDAGTLKRLDFAHIYNTPSFHAHASGNQTISDNTLTKVQFPSEDYDTSSTFDHSTNHRFTPGVAGKYFLYYQFKIETGANNNNFNYIEGHIYKNGSTIAKVNNDFRDDNLGRHHTITAGLVVESDADDYFEVFGLGNIETGTPLYAGGTNETFFGGYRLVGA